MEPWRTHIDTNSEGFRANRIAMAGLLQELEIQLEAARAGGGESSVARLRSGASSWCESGLICCSTGTRRSLN